MSSAADMPLLTVNDLQQMLAERDRLAFELAAVERRLEGARDLIGKDRFDEIAGTKAPKELRSFRGVMQDALEAHPHGLTYEELREALRDEGLGEMLERSPNNFFNTISRLQRLGEWAKAGERVMLKKYFDEMPEHLRAAYEAEGGSRTGAPAVVLKIMEEAGEPLSASAVQLRALKIEPGIKAQRVYAALSRLTHSGDIIRTADGRYRRPNQSVDDELPLDDA